MVGSTTSFAFKELSKACSILEDADPTLNGSVTSVAILTVLLTLWGCSSAIVYYAIVQFLNVLLALSMQAYMVNSWQIKIRCPELMSGPARFSTFYQYASETDRLQNSFLAGMVNDQPPFKNYHNVHTRIASRCWRTYPINEVLTIWVTLLGIERLHEKRHELNVSTLLLIWKFYDTMKRANLILLSKAPKCLISDFLLLASALIALSASLQATMPENAAHEW